MAVVGVAAPAGGVVLFLAVSGGVYVDGDYYSLLHGPSNLTGDFVGASDAFFQGETVLKVKVPPVRTENSLSPLYRGTDFSTLAETFQTVWGDVFFFGDQEPGVIASYGEVVPPRILQFRGCTCTPGSVRRENVYQRYQSRGRWLDFLPTLTIAAKNLATEMTNYNVEGKNLHGEPAITKEHMQNNQSVREMLGKHGIRPEELPPAEDIKKLERRVASEEKRMWISRILRKLCICARGCEERRQLPSPCRRTC